MTISAVKTDSEINSIPPTFLPRALTLDNFSQLFSQFNFGLLTLNSVMVSAGVVVLSLVLGGAALILLALPFQRFGVSAARDPRHPDDHARLDHSAALPDDGRTTADPTRSSAS